MKLKIILLCTVILAIKLNGYSQNKELVIKNRVNGKEVIIPEGKMVKVAFKGRVIRGNLILNDTIKSKLNNDEIEIATHPNPDLVNTYNLNLNEIKRINTVSYVGAGTTVIGVGIIIASLVILSSQTPVPQTNGENGDEVAGIADQNQSKLLGGSFVFLVGALVTGVGVMITVLNDSYDCKYWEFSIRTK